MLMFTAVLLSFLCQSGLTVNITDFENWKPDPENGTTYCEVISGAENHGGYACGSTSYAKMRQHDPEVTVSNTTDGSLGLLNIKWISKLAFSTQKEFYQTCKSYFIRLYDGLYTDYSEKRCVTTFPTPEGLNKTCNDTSNVIMKSGSGYCMSEQVCGATVPVVFFTPQTDNSTSIYAWGASVASFNATGEEVGRCYAYEIKPPTNPIDLTISSNTA